MKEQTITRSPIGEDRIREAFEYAASGMAMTDLEGRFEETNPAYRSLVGRDEEGLAQESILSITHADDRERCRAHLDELVTGNTTSFVLEKRYLRPDETAVWVRNSFSLLKGENGRPSRIISICNDISERRRAERLLVQSEKLALVGQLAASISHEINSPLEAVLNLLYLIHETNDPNEAHAFASQAEEEIQRAAQIASQTLQFYKQQNMPAATDVVSLLESVLGLFKAKLLVGKVDVRVEKRGQPQLICYSGEIRQVLANLIRNAIEAMPSGGELRLRVRHALDWRDGNRAVRITVADTGTGMSAETKARIYDPFFTTKGLQGTGLGLWVTSGLVMKHRGTMRVRSRDSAVKSGTAFVLTFPCAEA